MPRCSLLALVLSISSLACADDGGASDDDEVGTDSTSTGGSTDTDTSTDTGGSTDTGSGTDTSAETDTGTDTGGALICSGHPELCARPFDEVVFAGTHNSHASTSEGFSQFNANQVFPVATQLEDGVRVLLMDTYYGDNDEILLCHGPCNLGSSPHLEVLADIVAFLQANPGELITIIYQDAVTAADLALDYEQTGAVDLVYAHPSGEPWPTLGELVEADTRLIVTAEQGGPPPDWHHHVWDEAWDTPYGPQVPEDLSCELNRGSPDNDLFLVNHWVNNQLGLPSAENAEIVNAYDFLLARAQECRDTWDHAPNFLVVDFYDRGELFAVVDALNGVD